MSAYRLAWPHGDGTYGASRHAFVSPVAASRAARSLNPVRGARDLVPYTHLAEFDGAQLVKLVDLHEVAA